MVCCAAEPPLEAPASSLTSAATEDGLVVDEDVVDVEEEEEEEVPLESTVGSVEMLFGSVGSLEEKEGVSEGFSDVGYGRGIFFGGG